MKRHVNERCRNAALELSLSYILVNTCTRWVYWLLYRVQAGCIGYYIVYTLGVLVIIPCIRWVYWLLYRVHAGCIGYYIVYTLGVLVIISCIRWVYWLLFRVYAGCISYYTVYTLRWVYRSVYTITMSAVFLKLLCNVYAIYKDII